MKKNLIPLLLSAAAAVWFGGCDTGSDSGSDSGSDALYKTSYPLAGRIVDIRIGRDNTVYAAVAYTERSAVGILRLDENGKAVQTYGTDGLASAGVVTGTADAGALALTETNGEENAVVAGTYGSGGVYVLGLWKFDAAGRADTAFGQNGFVTDPFRIDKISAVQIAADSQQRIVVAGDDNSLLSPTAYLWRFRPDGSIDTAFNGSGLIEPTDTAPGIIDNGRFSLKNDDGVFYIGSVVGSADEGSKQVLMQYRSDGSPDASFGSGGSIEDNRRILECAMQSRLISALATDSEGRYYTAGTRCENGNADVTVLGYENNGSINTAFEGDGILTINKEAAESGNDIAVDAAGDLYVVATSADDHEAGSYLWKIDRHGPVVRTVHESGTSTCPVRFEAVAVDAKGDIVVGGSECGEPTVWKYRL